MPLRASARFPGKAPAPVAPPPPAPSCACLRPPRPRPLRASCLAFLLTFRTAHVSRHTRITLPFVIRNHRRLHARTHHRQRLPARRRAGGSVQLPPRAETHQGKSAAHLRRGHAVHGHDAGQQGGGHARRRGVSAARHAARRAVLCRKDPVRRHQKDPAGDAPPGHAGGRGHGPQPRDPCFRLLFREHGHFRRCHRGYHGQAGHPAGKGRTGPFQRPAVRGRFRRDRGLHRPAAVRRPDALLSVRQLLLTVHDGPPARRLYRLRRGHLCGHGPADVRHTDVPGHQHAAGPPARSPFFPALAAYLRSQTRGDAFSSPWSAHERADEKTACRFFCGQAVWFGARSVST